MYKYATVALSLVHLRVTAWRSLHIIRPKLPFRRDCSPSGSTTPAFGILLVLSSTGQTALILLRVETFRTSFVLPWTA